MRGGDNVHRDADLRELRGDRGGGVRAGGVFARRAHEQGQRERLAARVQQSVVVQGIAQPRKQRRRSLGIVVDLPVAAVIQPAVRRDGHVAAPRPVHIDVRDDTRAVDAHRDGAAEIVFREKAAAVVEEHRLHALRHIVANDRHARVAVFSGGKQRRRHEVELTRGIARERGLVAVPREEFNGLNVRGTVPPVGVGGHRDALVIIARHAVRAGADQHRGGDIPFDDGEIERVKAHEAGGAHRHDQRSRVQLHDAFDGVHAAFVIAFRAELPEVIEGVDNVVRRQRRAGVPAHALAQVDHPRVLKVGRRAPVDREAGHEAVRFVDRDQRLEDQRIEVQRLFGVHDQRVVKRVADRKVLGHRHAQLSARRGGKLRIRRGFGRLLRSGGRASGVPARAGAEERGEQYRRQCQAKPLSYSFAACIFHRNQAPF